MPTRRIGFENPTPLTNFLQLLEIFLVSAGLTWTFGHMVKKQAHGWALWAAMYVLFFVGAATAYWAEARGNPIHAARGIDVAASATQPGGNMEGKEVRFGIANSALYATITTDASCGCVNSMHDSFTPHRRHGAAGQHADGRADLRGRRAPASTACS